MNAGNADQKKTAGEFMTGQDAAGLEFLAPTILSSRPNARSFFLYSSVSSALIRGNFPRLRVAVGL
jgi:hypothetical protein